MIYKKKQYKTINNYLEVFNRDFLKKKFKQINKFDFNRALYRDAMIKDYIFFKKNINKKLKNILDIGVGIGISSYILRCMKFNVSACDIISKKFNMNQKFNQNEIYKSKFFNKITFRFIRNSILPFKKKFDIIFLYAVIEHVDKKNHKKFILEIERLTNKNSEIYIFMCPRKFSYVEHLSRMILGKKFAHENLYNLKDLKKIFGKKFKIVNYESSIALPSMLIHHQSHYAKIYILINYILEKTLFKPFLHHNRYKIIRN